MPNRIVIDKIGGPEVLKYEEYNLNNKIENKNVRIKNCSIGVNFIDTYHRSGLYPLPNKTPICPGLEAAGEILEIGNDVKGFNVGDRVCYASTPIGAYCDVRDFPYEKIVKIHDSITMDEAASIFYKV